MGSFQRTQGLGDGVSEQPASSICPKKGSEITIGANQSGLARRPAILQDCEGFLIRPTTFLTVAATEGVHDAIEVRTNLKPE